MAGHVVGVCHAALEGVPLLAAQGTVVVQRHPGAAANLVGQAHGLLRHLGGVAVTVLAAALAAALGTGKVLDVVPPGAGLSGSPRGLLGGIHRLLHLRRRSGHGPSEHLLRGRPGIAIRRQTVVGLKPLDGGNGVFAADPVNLPGVIPQVSEQALDLLGCHLHHPFLC